MLPIGLDSTVEEWSKKGVAHMIWGDVVITPECRKWLSENVKSENWHWDHFREEREVAIYFYNLKDALRFKLTWL